MLLEDCSYLALENSSFKNGKDCAFLHQVPGSETDNDSTGGETSGVEQRARASSAGSVPNDKRNRGKNRKKGKARKEGDESGKGKGKGNMD